MEFIPPSLFVWGECNIRAKILGGGGGLAGSMTLDVDFMCDNL